ncbi:uncharacterized protein [Mobula birostris]|uniref:uncharacterized protein n=1 Tax=Mobula birostris TaxID=1983395 RepID=UPI003B281184
MLSLRVCLCTVLMSVSVRGYNFSLNGWSMSGADVVSAVEGASAVLPCTFTHSPTELVPSGTVIWYRVESDARTPVLNCSYPDSGRSWCDTTLKTAGGRFGFVGNLSRRDASIMVQRLNRSDGGWYQCRVELNIDNFQTAVLTNLSVRAPGESVSVMTGTEGASATLPCEFTWPPQSLTAHTVTWMRKDPYRHIVTFRRYENGSWAAENGVTQYELIRDPERGNVSIRIKQLSVEDSHSYLCLAEFRKKNHDDSFNRDHVKPPFIHVFQSEIQLQVRAVHLWLMGRIRGTKRNVPRLTQSEQEQKPPQSVHDSSPLYDNIVPSSNNKEQPDSCTYASISTEGGKASKPQAEDREQPDSCTYASILFGGEKASKPQAKDRGGQKQEAGPAEVIYAAVVKK